MHPLIAQLLFMMLLSAPLLGANNGAITSVTITSHTLVTGQPYFLIDADEGDASATTNRHKIAISANTTFGISDNGTYTPRLVLQRARDNTVVAGMDGSSFAINTFGTINRIVSMDLDPKVKATATGAVVSGTGISRNLRFTVSQAGRGYLQPPTVNVTYRYTNPLTFISSTRNVTTTCTLNSLGGIASINPVSVEEVGTIATITVSLPTPPPLDPNETYILDFMLLNARGAVEASRKTPEARWLNFTGTMAGSSSRNSFLDIAGPLSLSRNHLLRDAAASSIDGQFALSIPCRIYRYDNWTAAASGSETLVAQFEIAMRDDLGTTVALGSVDPTSFTSVAQFQAGPLKTPTVTNRTATVRFRPTNPAALDFLNRTYTVSVREMQISDDWETIITTATPQSELSALRLLPLSGQLHFGAAPVATSMLAVSSAMLSPNLPNLQLNVTAAQVKAAPLLTFADPSLRVVVDANGDCVYNEPNTAVDVIPVSSAYSAEEEKDVKADVAYLRSNYLLHFDGLQADLLVDLPAGAKWQNNTGSKSARFKGKIQMTDVALNGDRSTLDTHVTYEILGDRVHLTEESNPLVFSGDRLEWRIEQGEFELKGGLQASSLAKEAILYLKAARASFASATMETKRSNDFLHSTAKNPSYVTIKADTLANGGAQLYTEYDLGDEYSVGVPFEYHTHMPYDVKIAPSLGGHVKVEAGRIQEEASSLGGIAKVDLSYNRACTDTDCIAAADQELQRLFPDDSTLRIAANGALHGVGVMNAAPLKWGKRSDGSFAHGLDDPFTQGTFMTAGSFARHQAKPENGAFSVLNTGFRVDGLKLVAEEPNHASYTAGLGDYPGMNLRVGVGMATGAAGSSVLGGSTITYTMRQGNASYAGSKYYTRYGGVSGIHDTQLDSGTSSKPLIYDYPFTLTSFAFNLLSSQLQDSLVDGSIFFDSPSNFTQNFKQLQISCRGELGELTPIGVEKKLEHWDCAIEVLAASFVRSSADVCEGGSASYQTSIRARSHHVPVALIGNLGLMPSGEIISAADARYDGDKLITSRFVLPRCIEIQGPIKGPKPEPTPEGWEPAYEIWNYSSVQDAYLSDYEPGVTAHAKGFWNLIGTLDVPFFRDLQVHLQTIAIDTVGGADDSDSEIHVMGGWPDDGWSEDGGNPFNTTLFDSHNRGLPTTLLLADYRAGGTASGEDPLPYRVKAAQTWLEVVDFDYELIWDPVRKTFEAKEVPNSEILVVNIGHNCLRISPDFAEINFGFSYDGLPQINLSQMAFNAIDDTTGVASSLSHSLGEQGFDALTGGVDRFAKMVGDRMDEVMDEHVDAIMGTPLNVLDSALAGKFTAGYSVDSSQITTAVDTAFGVGSSLPGTIKQKLELLINGGSSGVALSQNLVAQLDQVLDALDSCANLNRYGAGVDDAVLKDLFNTLPIGPSDPTVLEALAQDLVTSLAAAITAEALDAVWAAILEKHEDKVIAVEEALAMIYVRVKAVRDELNDLTGDFNKELEEIVAAAKTAGEIETAINEAAAEVKADIAALSNLDVTVSWDLIKDEQKAKWLQIVKNKLHASPFVTKISTAIKERLYDLEARMHSALDSGIDALNDTLKDAIKDQLAGMDESINHLVGGKLDDIVGAGQIKGYAHITTDSLELLRLDGRFRWKVPEEMMLDAYLEIRSMNSAGDNTCAGVASNATDVELGALDTPLEWISPGLRADVSAKFAFGSGSLIGFGGGFKMRGELSYETFIITDMQAQIAFGQTENYLAAEVGLAFSSYKLKGGIFFGRCCSPDPIEAIDPDVTALIPGPSFTGAYAYGEGWIPIIGNGCFFNISAGVGAGAFYFAEGPTYGGKMLAGVSGEALCAVSIKGEIELIGVKSGGDFSFSGEGRISGKAGVCPFCVKFSEMVQATYINNSWDVDY